MNSMRPIVAATDFSAPARHAAQRAAMLAQACGAPLTLMHTIQASALDDLRRWLAHDHKTIDAVEAHARRCLDELAAELAQAHPIEVRTHLSAGHPVEHIAGHADDTDARLLVIGTRGAGFFRGTVVGSTAERIANGSPRPVLMVRQIPHQPYERVLVPVDFSEWSAHAIRMAHQLAPGATLVLMHAVERFYEGRMRLAGVADEVVMQARSAALREAQQRLRDLTESAGLEAGRVRWCTPSGADPWMLIVQQEQEFACDLVVIGRQGRHALDEFFLGSTTRRYIAEGSADVLICSSPAG